MIKKKLQGIQADGTVQQRRVYRANGSALPYTQILEQSAIERFICRPSEISCADKLTLKRPLMFPPCSGLLGRSAV